MKKILVAAVAALALLTVTGCGDDAADKAAAAADGASDENGDDNAPCDLLEAAEVAAILGETPDPQRNGGNPGGQLCLWDRADKKQSLWLQQLAPQSNQEEHPDGYGWTAEEFTEWTPLKAEPVDGLGDDALYEVKDQLSGGKAFALAVLHHGERVFVLEYQVKGADGSEAAATLEKLRPVAAKITERH